MNISVFGTPDFKKKQCFTKRNISAAMSNKIHFCHFRFDFSTKEILSDVHLNFYKQFRNNRLKRTISRFINRLIFVLKTSHFSFF